MFVLSVGGAAASVKIKCDVKHIQWKMKTVILIRSIFLEVIGGTKCSGEECVDGDKDRKEPGKMHLMRKLWIKQSFS